MVSSTLTPEQIHLATTVLLAELRHADYIIKIMLNAMTVQQKARVAEKLEAAGVAGEGMTRHHERAAVMAAATAPTIASAIALMRAATDNIIAPAAEGGGAKMSRRPIVKVPAAPLTDMEMRIALAFRRFKPEMKKDWVETMENVAKNYEIEAAAARPARSLRLVVGGTR